MATDSNIATSQDGTQIAGKALIVYGTVQAHAPDGMIRTLQPNSPIYVDDRIITGSDGAVSIIFDDPEATQLDIGRMTDMVVDQDVLGTAAPGDVAEAAADVEQIQQALLADETFDPTTQLQAPAAGPAEDLGPAGGGHPVVRFELDGAEVTPQSGAETVGVEQSHLQFEFAPPDVEQQVVAEPTASTAPAVAPEDDGPTPFVDEGISESLSGPSPATLRASSSAPENTVPSAGIASSSMAEDNLPDGGDPDGSLQDSEGNLVSSGGLGDLGIDFGGNGPGELRFTNFDDTDTETMAIDGDPTHFIEVTGAYGTLVMKGDGAWTYTLDDNVFHDDPAATGADDGKQDFFSFTVTDVDGDSVSGSFTVDILDDGPVLAQASTRIVEEEALDSTVGVSVYPVRSLGNQDDNDPYEDSDYHVPAQNDAVQVSGDLNAVVSVGADSPGTFGVDLSLGELPTLSSQGGMVRYRLNDTMLEAYVDHGGQEDVRIVFTLDVQPDGVYTYTLYDQLDHVQGDGENSALQLFGSEASVESIDFSPVITVTDSDFDSLSGLQEGTFNFIVVDDIPTMTLTGRSVGGEVQEDALDSAHGDFSDGIAEGGVSDTLSVNLADLVTWQPGADETASVTFGLTGLESSPASGLSSNGNTVYYHQIGNTLIATTSESAPTSLDEANVFTFTIDDPNIGTATFDLNDRLDHGEASGDSGLLSINDLGNYVSVTIIDADNDSSSVTLNDSILINVENDVPGLVETAKYYFVSEYAGYNNVIGTYELDELGNPVNPRIIVDSTNDAVKGGLDDGNNALQGQNEQLIGSFEAGTKMFLVADGARYKVDDADDLRFRVGEDGEPPWVLQVKQGDEGSFDDVAGKGIYFMDSWLDSTPPLIDGATHFTDQWATSPWPDHYLTEAPRFGAEVRIEDQNLGDGDYNDTVLRVENGPVVSESNLDDGTGTDPNSQLSVSGNFFSATDAGIRLTTGADVPLTLHVVPRGVTSEAGFDYSGTEATFEVTASGGTLTSKVFQGEAGALEIWSNGDWTYTLETNTLSQADNDKAYSGNHDGDFDRFSSDQVQEVFSITATDSDGDGAQAYFVININDDGPDAGAGAQNAILAYEDGNSLVADLNVDPGADGYGTVVINPLDGDERIADGDVVEGVTWHHSLDNGSWQASISENVSVTVAPEKIDGLFTGNYTVQQEGADESGSDHHFTFVAEVTDGDGDSVETEFSVTVDADGILEGGEGADVIAGSEGDDIIVGGEGADVIDGGKGDDTIDGGEGDDVIDGGEGDDTIDGGEGVDVIVGGEGADSFDGGEVAGGEVSDYDPLDNLVPPVEPL